MRVFLSWSGAESQQVALALREWLPNVIQALDPWVSSSDIEKGESWFSAISESLVAAGGMGIFCLTPGNLNAPWLAYEAGALAAADRGRVATFLYGIHATEVKPPLGLFQGTDSSSRSDVLRLLTTINGRLQAPLNEARLQKAFETHWDSLTTQLKEIPAPATPDKKKQEIDLAPVLNEILAVVRRIEKDAAGKVAPDPVNPYVLPPRFGGGQGLLGLSAEQLQALAEEGQNHGGNRLLDRILAKREGVEGLLAGREATFSSIPPPPPAGSPLSSFEATPPKFAKPPSPRVPVPPRRGSKD